MFKRLKEWWESKKTRHTVTVVVEFEPTKLSEQMIAYLSDYVSSLIRDNESILTDVQKQPAGYRATFVITYTTTPFSHHNYHKELARLSDWLLSDKACNGCLARYHYNCV